MAERFNLYKHLLNNDFCRGAKGFRVALSDPRSRAIIANQGKACRENVMSRDCNVEKMQCREKAMSRQSCNVVNEKNPEISEVF